MNRQTGQPQQYKEEEIIQRRLTVPVSTDQAFDFFTAKLTNWWPPEYTWSQDVLETIAIEPGVNGRCFERGPFNFECDWGRVLVWEPPRRLVFTWQISPGREPVPDPSKASEVEVRFEAESASSTQVIFEHRRFARHGDGAADYRAMLDSPQGWPYILDCYREAIKETER